MEEIYNNVLISGHGALIRAMISVVVSLPDSYFWSGKEQGNCAVTIMECKNKEIKVNRRSNRYTIKLILLILCQ